MLHRLVSWRSEGCSGAPRLGNACKDASCCAEVTSTSEEQPKDILTSRARPRGEEQVSCSIEREKNERVAWQPLKCCGRHLSAALSMNKHAQDFTRSHYDGHANKHQTQEQVALASGPSANVLVVVAAAPRVPVRLLAGLPVRRVTCRQGELGSKVRASR